MRSPFTVRKSITVACHHLAQLGLIAGTEGNISVRLDDGRIMITPTGANKGLLTPEELVIIDENGKHLQGSTKASSEVAMHIYLYHQRADISAIVHAHPPYATAFAVAGVPLQDNILPEVALFIGNIPTTDYAMPGTDELPKSLEPFVERHVAFLLRNHGLLTIGRDLTEAMNRHETVEHYAKIVHLAFQLGNVGQIPSDDYQRLEKLRSKLDQVLDKKT